MNAERLFALFDRVSEAPDAVAKLRRLVLDLAVRGKLVELDPADEPAAELLKRIAKEKFQLAHDGKFKTYGGNFDRDESAFEYSIPTNWAWCYLDDIAAVARGGSPRPIESFLTDDPNGIPWIKIGDSQRSSVYLNDTRERIKPEGLAKSRLVIAGDLLLSNSMSFGFPYITNIEGCIHDGWLVIRTPEGLVDKLFLHKLLLSGHAKAAFSKAAAGAVVQNLNADKVRQLSVPLPPLAEQHRIVAKVDELMALCDQLEAARTERERRRDRLAAASLARLSTPDPTNFQADARFALETLPVVTARMDQIGQLRQTILNFAVRGGLSHQDVSDEPAATSMASNIREDDELRGAKPSRRNGEMDVAERGAAQALPSGWRWSTLGELALSMRYGTSMKCEHGTVGAPVLRIPNVSGGVIKLDDMKFGALREQEVRDLRLIAGDILMIRSNGSLEIVGRSAVVTPEAEGMAFAGYLVRLRLRPACVTPRYVWLAMNSTDVRDQIERPIRSAVGLKNVNLTEFGALTIPFPPLAEQHRIVAKVDELVALCDQLQASLTAADATRSRLLDALLHEALNGPAQAEAA